MSRVKRFFDLWYVDQRRYRMSADDWQYIAILLAMGNLAVGLGLLLGLLWISIA